MPGDGKNGAPRTRDAVNEAANEAVEEAFQLAEGVMAVPTKAYRMVFPDGTVEFAASRAEATQKWLEHNPGN